MMKARPLTFVELENNVRRLKVSEHTAIGMMLDEIERLRQVLEKDHTADCAVLRRKMPCDCGHEHRKVQELLHETTLRAELVRLKRLAQVHEAEVHRLDLELLKRRRG